MHRTNKSPGAQEGDAGQGDRGLWGRRVGLYEMCWRDRWSATLLLSVICFFNLLHVLCSVLLVLLWQLPLPAICVQLHRSHWAFQICSQKEQLLPEEMRLQAS